MIRFYDQIQLYSYYNSIKVNWDVITTQVPNKLLVVVNIINVKLNY